MGMTSNAKHLTANGRRRNVKAGTVVKTWLTDCMGVLTDASVVDDLCWGNFNVKLDGRLARVEWVDDLNAYRLVRYI